MAEAKKTEYTAVRMTDGREVQFAGKRKVNKETLIDESKIEYDEASGILRLQAGAIAVRMDYRNGETRTYYQPLSLVPKFAGHGGEQKYGDELASPADKPLSEEDMVVATDDLDAQIQKGEWGKGRAAGGGSVSGASIVLQAILEATNQGRPDNGKQPVTIADVKAYVQRMLDKEATKPEGERISRRALYDSFRAEGSKTAPIIKRLEAEKAAKDKKEPAIDANAAMEEIEAA